VHEGGISTPLIAHWPAGIPDRGGLRHNPGHVIDLTATILDIADAKPPDTPPAPGVSLLPVFARDHTVLHEYLWWYHEGNRALRVGDWKIVEAGETGDWELYDLSKYRAESRNLANRHPEKLAELIAIWTARRDAFRTLALQDLDSK
jgi:arylsulfatase